MLRAMQFCFERYAEINLIIPIFCDSFPDSSQQFFFSTAFHASLHDSSTKPSRESENYLRMNIQIPPKVSFHVGD